MLTSLIQKALHRIGIHASRVSSHATLADNLLARRRALPDRAYGFRPHEIAFYNYYIRKREVLSLQHSHSQLGQDLWIAYLLNAISENGRPGTPGYFVEFGAFDGKTFSNTFFLERELGWSGILAEPIPEQLAICRSLRTCSIDSRCVWKESGKQLKFNVVPGSNEFGTIAGFGSEESHSTLRAARRKEIEVTTVSLYDLLREHGAPAVVDYLSLDTEGSELEILEAFPFDSFQIKTLSVEHNFTSRRPLLDSLLRRYRFARLERSVDYFDDIYLNKKFFP